VHSVKNHLGVLFFINNMTEIIKKKKILTDKIKNSANTAIAVADKYISSFTPDIFGKQKLNDKSEADFFALSETLHFFSEQIMDQANALLALEKKSESAESMNIRESARLVSEIPDLCVDPFLLSVYEEIKKDVADVGNIRRAASVFSAKLHNYITRIS